MAIKLKSGRILYVAPSDTLALAPWANGPYLVYVSPDSDRVDEATARVPAFSIVERREVADLAKAMWDRWAETGRL